MRVAQVVEAARAPLCVKVVEELGGRVEKQKCALCCVCSRFRVCAEGEATLRHQVAITWACNLSKNLIKTRVSRYSRWEGRPTHVDHCCARSLVFAGTTKSRLNKATNGSRRSNRAQESRLKRSTDFAESYEESRFESYVVNIGRQPLFSPLRATSPRQ